MMKTRKHSLLRSTRIESGQAILLIAFMMVGLIGVLGMAIDGGGLYFLHRDTQNAADAAVLAALYTKCTLYPVVNDAAVIAAGTNAAKSNGFQSDDRATVTIDPAFTPPGGSGGGLMVRAEITAKKPSYFIQLVYPQPLMVTSSTVGQCFPSGLRLLPFGMAMISLRTTGCIGGGGGVGDSPAFRVSGTGLVNVYTGSIYVNSNHASCALQEDGSSQLIVHNGTCAVVGNPGVDGSPTCSGGITHPTGDDRVWSTHPLSDLDPPDDACALTKTAQVRVNPGNTRTIDPGHYGELSVRGTLHLNPGMYCVEEITVNGGTITGDNVVIYMPEGTDRSISAPSTSTIRLNAPGTVTACPDTAGAACDWPGLLLWADISDAEAAVELAVAGSELHFNGGSNSIIHGMVYAPRSNCRWEGGTGGFAINSQITCWSMDLEGNSQLDINFEQPEFLRTSPSVILNQ